MRRWTLAVGAALALALLTLPATSSEFSIESLPLIGAGTVLAAEACEADAKPAPLNFTLKDMDGQDVDLEQFRGKIILLNFWATWCGPCKIEIPGFIELQDEYGDDGFIVLGLSVDDSADQIQDFSREFNVNYPMLQGLGEEEFQEAWGPVWGLPMSFWVDRDGTWCKTHMGIGTKDDFEADLKSLL
jgi:thiol-disulfide isomerase/thioredoxin